MARTCETCEHSTFRGDGSDCNVPKKCTRYAPTLVDCAGIAKWPLVNLRDYCGEYQLKKYIVNEESGYFE